MFTIKTKKLRGKNLIPHTSYYPIMISFAVLGLALSLVAFMHGTQYAIIGLLWFTLLLLVPLIRWWRDLFTEFSTFEQKVIVEEGKLVLVIEPANFRRYLQEFIKGTKVAMVLFIISEVMFFFSFFWAFFHSSGSPAIQIGAVWPPFGLSNAMPNPLLIPLVNTVILLSSGVTVTWAHLSLMPQLDVVSNRLVGPSKDFILNFVLAMSLTIFLAINFISWQIYEFIFNTVQMSDGIFGSTFYILTGFHGFHVIIGTIFLSVFLVKVCFNIYYCHEGRFAETYFFYSLLLGRLKPGSFSPYGELRVKYIPSVGFDCSVWYWHFVDIVWLFLFSFVYLPDFLLLKLHTFLIPVINTVTATIPL